MWFYIRRMGHGGGHFDPTLEHHTNKRKMVQVYTILKVLSFLSSELFTEFKNNHISQTYIHFSSGSMCMFLRARSDQYISRMLKNQHSYFLCDVYFFIFLFFFRDFFTGC